MNNTNEVGYYTKAEVITQAAGRPGRFFQCWSNGIVMGLVNSPEQPWWLDKGEKINCGVCLGWTWEPEGIQTPVAIRARDQEQTKLDQLDSIRYLSVSPGTSPFEADNACTEKARCGLRTCKVCTPNFL
jgi:hypothetical protein